MGLQRYDEDGEWVKADEAETRIKELQEENAKLRKALEKYADEKNWSVFRYIQNKVQYARWCADFGPILAKEALE